MEFAEVVRSRRMARNFSTEPVDGEVLDRILDAGRRAPAAGNSRGTHFVVLEGPDQTALYWDEALPPTMREGFRWPGLLKAPVLILPLASAQAYLDRYRQADKQLTGLGDAEDRWPVPYWHVDTGMAAMTMLLAATDEGLGALFFGIFAHEVEVCAALGIPPGLQPIGTIALGHPLREDPGRSASRGLPAFDEIVHRGGW